MTAIGPLAMLLGMLAVVAIADRWPRAAEDDRADELQRREEDLADDQAREDRELEYSSAVDRLGELLEGPHRAPAHVGE